MVFSEHLDISRNNLKLFILIAFKFGMYIGMSESIS